MKIAVFENEKSSVDGALDYANLRFYQNSLEYTFFESSQSFTGSWSMFDLIIIDIDLSRRSHLDGYSLLKEISKDPLSFSKTIVITAHQKVKEKLNEQNISEIPVLYKPVDFNQIHEIFEKKGIVSKQS